VQWKLGRKWIGSNAERGGTQGRGGIGRSAGIYIYIAISVIPKTYAAANGACAARLRKFTLALRLWGCLLPGLLFI
jgi:hypothetical protein